MKRIAVILSILSCTSIVYGQLDTMFTAGQSATYSSNVRGYLFISPVDMTITKIYVPTDANAGNQNIAVIKVRGNYSYTSAGTPIHDQFDLLYLVQDSNSNDWLNSNIPIKAGDTIVILGNRSDINSYTSQFSKQFADISGNSIELYRMASQVRLSTTVPQQLITDYGNGEYAISRVFFEYCSGSSCVCRSISSPKVTNASSSTSSDGSISVDLGTDNNNIRYLRWATKEGVNYPATNAEDVNGLVPGDYTLFIVTKDYLTCYVGPVTVGP